MARLRSWRFPASLEAKTCSDKTVAFPTSMVKGLGGPLILRLGLVDFWHSLLTSPFSKGETGLDTLATCGAVPCVLLAPWTLNQTNKQTLARTH